MAYIVCPKCYEEKDLTVFGDHYFCNRCFSEFHLIEDRKKMFPENCVFPTRPKEYFYRSAYYQGPFADGDPSLDLVLTPDETG
jgi:hypothetical protein